jgi:hypothetical protein
MSLLKYDEFLFENKNNNGDKQNFAILENEYLRMKSEGLDEETINENVFSSLLGSLGGGFTDTFKDYVIDWAAEKLGISTQDETGNPSFFYQLIRNVIEGISVTDLGSYFGKGSCKNWSKAVVEGLSETLQERGLEYLLERLGLKVDMSQGIGGSIAAGLRETLTNSINDTAFLNRIEGIIGDKICGFNLGDVLSSKGITGSDKQALATQVQSAGEKNPDIYSSIMKSGLASVLGGNKA